MVQRGLASHDGLPQPVLARHRPMATPRKRQNPGRGRSITRTVQEAHMTSFILPYPEFKIHTAQWKPKHSKNSQTPVLEQILLFHEIIPDWNF